MLSSLLPYIRNLLDFFFQNADSETTSAKIHGSEVNEDACELSLGSTEADNADYAKDKNYSRNIEGTGTVEVQQKGKRYYRRKPEIEESVNHLEDTKEACSGTEEGQQLCDFKGKFDCEVEAAKTSRASVKGPRKRSKKVLFEGGMMVFASKKVFFPCSLFLFFFPLVCNFYSQMLLYPR